jgi:cytoskeletal protein RodZ
VNEPTDIKALDEYLKGGSDISQHYRELGRDDVPPELDRRVLDEARAAVANGGARRGSSWLRWSAPVALAASVVLVVTVVIENGVPKDTAYVVQQPASEETKLYDEQPAQDQPTRDEYFAAEAPAPQPAAAPAAPPPPAPARERSLAKKAEAEDNRLSGLVPEEVRVEAKARRDQLEQPTPVTTVSSVDAAEPQVAAQNVAPPEADADLSSVSVSGTRARRATGRTAGPRNTISGASVSGEMRQSADAAAQAQQSEPEKWLEDIRELRRKGKIADADREWLRFTEAYPDFEVADDDIARKH